MFFLVVAFSIPFGASFAPPTLQSGDSESILPLAQESRQMKARARREGEGERTMLRAPHAFFSRRTRKKKNEQHRLRPLALPILLLCLFVHLRHALEKTAEPTRWLER